MGFLTGAGDADLDDRADTVLTAGFFSAGFGAAAERFLTVFVTAFFAAGFFAVFFATFFAAGFAFALAFAFAGVFFAGCFFFTIEFILSHPLDV